MCPCDLAREYVCRGCAAAIEEKLGLLASLNGDGNGSGELARAVRGELLAAGVKVDIVKLRMEQRRREKETA